MSSGWARRSWLSAGEVLGSLGLTVGEALGILIPSVLSAVAAYFAWKSYSRRPRLKFYLQEESVVIRWSGKDDRANVYCWLANDGKVAAHNVHGWLRYGDDPSRITAEEDEYSGVFDATDNSAAVYLERLMPNPSHELGEGFIDSPKLFGWPVRVWKAGEIELKYRFVCDEGAKTEGTLRVNFPEQALARPEGDIR